MVSPANNNASRLPGAFDFSSDATRARNTEALKSSQSGQLEQINRNREANDAASETKRNAETQQAARDDTRGGRLDVNA